MRTATLSVVWASFLIVNVVGCGQFENHAGQSATAETTASGQSGAWTLGAPIIIREPAPGQPSAPSPGQPLAQPATQPATQPMAPLMEQPGMSGSTLYIVLGGNGSCTASSISKIVPGLIEARIFKSFIDAILIDGLVRQTDQVIFGCYEWMSSEMNFYELKGNQRMQPLHEAQLDALVLSRAQAARKIVIIGHSYGGWRAMKLASSPYLINNLRAPMILVTFDPISKVMCQRIREAGCREAPTDLSPAELYQLNTRTRWLNAYQESALLLGSGPIAAAHYNIRANARHLEIQTDQSVWAAVKGFVTSFIAAP